MTLTCDEESLGGGVHPQIRLKLARGADAEAPRPLTYVITRASRCGRRLRGAHRPSERMRRLCVAQ